MNSTSTQTPYAQLPADKVAELRSYIRQNMGRYPIQVLSQAIQEKYGVSAQQVMEPNPSDFGREVAQGLTFGHYDELRGLGAKLTGGDYTQARDAIRRQDAAFSQSHPFLNFATQAAAGGV